MIGHNNLQTQRWSTNANTYTLASYVVASLNSPILVVLASFLRTNESGVSVTSITWNSQNLTEAINSTGTSSSRSYYAGIWYLVNPSAATGDIVATLGASMGGAILSVFTLYDAAQSGMILDTKTFTDTTDVGTFDTAVQATEPTFRAAMVVSNAANNPTWTWTVSEASTAELYDLNEGSSTTGEIAGSGFVVLPNNGYRSIGFTCSTTPARTVGVAVQFDGVAVGSLIPARRTRTYIRM